MVTVCLPCSANCALCQSAALCISCVAGFFMNSKQECGRGCPDRFYPSEQTFTCQKCPYDCLKCTHSGNCISCNSSDLRVLFTNLSRCLPLPGFYDNGSRVSIPCPPSCKLCQSATYCISCVPGYFLNIDYTCLDSCPAHFYRDKVTLSCLRCPYDC